MPRNLQRIATYMAIGFLSVAVLMTSTVGWKFGGFVLALGLALVTIGAAILPSYAHHAWCLGHRGSSVVIGLTAAVFAVAEYGSHVSYAVTHRSAEIETVSHATTGFSDQRSTIASLEAKERQLDAQARWESRALPDIIAAIEKAKLNRRWTATSECTDVTATASRAFCADYASLLAEKANAEEAATVRAELDTVRKELAEARQTSETKAPSVSMASTTDTLAAQLASFSLEPSADARKAAGIGIGAWLALAFSLGAGVFWFLANMPAAHGASGHVSVHPEPIAPPVPVAPQPTIAQQAAAAAQKLRNMHGRLAIAGTGIHGIKMTEAA